VSGASDIELWNHYQLDDPKSFAIGHARQDALFRHIRRLVPFGKLLEIGFGDGYLLRHLAPYYVCHAADISSDHIEKISRALPQIAFAVVAPDGKLPYPEESFDIFVASEVFEHMDNAQLTTAVAEMSRVLRAGGRAVVTFPARENLKENQSFCPHCGTIFHKWGHKQSWDRDKIQRIFAAFSIESLSERHFGSDQLNLFGKLEAALRIALSKFRPVSQMTYLLILKK
jgi:ubiquinone/menaquinone biosynthesis C-methylase UbiE